MSNRIPMPHPGEILLEEYMIDLGISVESLSREIGVPVAQIAEVTQGRQPITAPLAHKLGRYFGNEAGFWLRLQLSYDIRESLTPELRAELERIQPHPRVAEIANTPIPFESEEDAARRDAYTPALAA
jgi:addiction module HigA family antidote